MRSFLPLSVFTLVVCNGGRTESASEGLKAATSRIIFSSQALALSSISLCFSSSYVYRAPFAGLIVIVIVCLFHFFLFLPVFITLLPPGKKAVQKNNLKPKKPKLKRLRSEILTPASFQLSETQFDEFLCPARAPAVTTCQEAKAVVECVTTV